MRALDDDRLIASMLSPPPLEDARNSLAFWERRRAELPLYRRAARREADEMIRRCRERVAAAERLRYGTGFAGLVRRLLAQDLPTWPAARVALLPFVLRLVPRRLVLVVAAAAAVWLTTVAVVVVAIVALAA